jgi:hypothetical protein
MTAIVKKYVVGNRIYALHQRLGWLILGSWGWQKCGKPLAISTPPEA